jgi:hypothetical protein
MALFPRSLRCGGFVRFLRYLLRGAGSELMPAIDPFVWSGRASQEISSIGFSVCRSACIFTPVGSAIMR